MGNRFVITNPPQGTTYGEWHVVHVEALGDDEHETTVFHPETCRISILDPPGHPMAPTREYQCMTTHEIGNVGFDTMFPDGMQAGLYLVRPWVEYIPANLEHMGDWDGGVEVIEYRPQFGTS